MDKEITKQELFKKTYIKSEGDLPKTPFITPDDYTRIFTHVKGNDESGMDIYDWYDYSIDSENYKHQIEYWLETFDWYLQPLQSEKDKINEGMQKEFDRCRPIESLQSDKDEPKESKLYQCPYSKATRCNLKDCCLECETFGEFQDDAFVKLYEPKAETKGAEEILREYLRKYIKTVHATKIIQEVGLSNLMNAPYMKLIIEAMQEYASQPLPSDEDVNNWIEKEMPINTDDEMDEEVNKWCRKAVRLFVQAMRDGKIKSITK